MCIRDSLFPAGAEKGVEVFFGIFQLFGESLDSFYTVFQFAASCLRECTADKGKADGELYPRQQFPIAGGLEQVAVEGIAADPRTGGKCGRGSEEGVIQLLQPCGPIGVDGFE